MNDDRCKVEPTTQAWGKKLEPLDSRERLMNCKHSLRSDEDNHARARVTLQSDSGHLKII
jgi:hypothetical protein